MRSAVKRKSAARQTMSPERDQQIGSVSRRRRKTVSITDRARATALDAMVEHVVYHDPKLRIQWVNRAAAESVGLPPEKLEGFHCYEIWQKRKTPCVNCPVVKARETGQPHEEVMTSPDERVWRVRGYPDKDAKGRIVGLVEVTLEISEQKKVEEELRKSEELYRGFVEEINDAIYAIDKDGICTYISPIAEKIHGYKPEELIGDSMLRIVHPDDLPMVQKAFAEITQSEPKPIELRIIAKNGAVKWIRVLGKAVLKDGNYTGVRGVLSDITEQKQTMEALRKSEEKFRSLFETTHEAIGTSGPDGRILDANPAMARLLGVKAQEDLIGLPAVDLYADPVDRKTLFAELKKNGYVENFELTLVKQDGSGDHVHILGNATLHADEKGNTLRTDFIFSDITERKKAVEFLRESEEKYRTLTENINVGIYRNTPGPEGRFIEANPAIVKVFGYSSKEIFLNVSVSELYQNPDRRKMFNGKMLENGYVKNEEVLLKRKDGTPFLGSVTAVAIYDEKGKVKYYDGVIEDITERKRSEEIIRESEEKFRTLADQSPNMIFINQRGKVVYANPKCEKILGYSREELCSPDFDFLALMPAESQEIVKANFAKHAQGIDVPPYEYTLITKAGERIDAILASKLIDYQGERAILGTVTDISERKIAEEEVKQSLKKMEGLLEGIVNTMSITVETRDQYTAGHQRRVAALARAIADEMKLSEEQSKSVYMASLIHDIGKIAIPAEILSKPTTLSEVEFSIIETHPQVGYDILKGIDFPWPIAEIVLKHHERVNGSGYPQGLTGDEIPLEAKILCVADVVETMASHRPYRAALGIGKALEEITQNKGKLYDEGVVKACLKVFYDHKFSFDEE
jgi:PAS domain S-box-containing protein/putative nucleotidyltransferase with HDIG domain